MRNKSKTTLLGVQVTVALVLMLSLDRSVRAEEQQPSLGSLAVRTPTVELPRVQPHPADAKRKWPRLWTDILLLLFPSRDLVDEEHAALPDKLKQLIAAHQPQSGDVLLSVIADPEHSFYSRATRAFLKNWNAMSPQQIDAYLQSTIRLWARPKVRYPQGMSAAIQMKYDLPAGWGGANSEDLKMRTSHFLDGEPYGNTVAHQGTRANLGYVSTSELSLGRHTMSALLEYEFTHHGTKHTGWIKSPEFSFEMVDAAAPDDLIAPPDPQVDQLVRDSLHIAETQKALDNWPSAQGISRDDPNSESWGFQYLWESPKGKTHKWHLPVWRVSRPLPIDLCFEVQIQDVKTGKTYEADPVIVPRGKVVSAHFRPLGAIEHFGLTESGLVWVRILLKPSRILALDSPEIERYYSGSITTGVLRIKVLRPRDD